MQGKLFEPNSGEALLFQGEDFDFADIRAQG